MCQVVAPAAPALYLLGQLAWRETAQQQDEVGELEVKRLVEHHPVRGREREVPRKAHRLLLDNGDPALLKQREDNSKLCPPDCPLRARLGRLEQPCQRLLG